MSIGNSARVRFFHVVDLVNKLKHFRRFATRYDRRDIHFLGFIRLAAAMIWMR